jgi:hypothetical protein
MPSPFPGMNPYLEQEDAWHDFHGRFIPYAAEMLAPQVRPNFIVKIDETVYVREVGDEERRVLGRADVFLSETELAARANGATAVLEAPARVRLPEVDEETLLCIEIQDRESRQLITVIELLSPTNKYAGEKREQYLTKRDQILASGVHLVEIDLLRGGPRMPMSPQQECDYCVLVSCAETRPEAGIWPLRLCDPLPTIPIPLKTPGQVAKLDLKAVLDRAYDAAGYEDYIYRKSPVPKLAPDDAAWAEQLLPAKSKSS